MPSRPRAHPLTKLLQGIPQPFYVLDDALALIYCNTALLEWTGCELEQLLGKKCRYHGGGAKLRHEKALAAMAPPPEAIAGRHVRATIVMDRVESLDRRRAEFLPLTSEASGEDSFAGMLVLVDARTVTTKANRPLELVGAPVSLEREEAEALHERLSALRSHDAWQADLERFPATGDAMRRLRRQAMLAARSEVSVLIVGPPGSGREHLARAIHHAANRFLAQEKSGVDAESGSHPTGALLPVDCRALGSDLIAGTIDAFFQRYQRPERSGEGTRHVCNTLLLLEADLFPVECREDLLRRLEQQSPWCRVMGTTPLPLSHWQTARPVGEKLATLCLELPRLTDRREDLPLLAQQFVEQENARGKKQRAGFSSDALDLLDRYHWPGEVAELAEVVSQAHQQSGGMLIEPGDLPRRLHDAADAVAHAPRTPRPIDLEAYLETVEREVIERALRASDGNKSQAAKLLGMTRPKLYRRLEQLQGDAQGEPSPDEKEDTPR
jgi:transcriptional regulator of acetoin/glycerol metabolism